MFDQPVKIAVFAVFKEVIFMLKMVLGRLAMLRQLKSFTNNSNFFNYHNLRISGIEKEKLSCSPVFIQKICEPAELSSSNGRFT